MGTVIRVFCAALFPTLLLAQTPGEWPLHGYDLQGTRYSTLRQIDTSTIKDLAPAWTWHSAVTATFQATPIVLDTVMYVSLPFSGVAALDDFTHPSFARVRKVTVLEEPGPQLALVSELVPGERLSKVLKSARLSGLRANAGAAIYLLRRLLPPVGDLHARQVAHGLLTHDRIIVSAQGEFFITEHVLPGALAALELNAEELWQRFGIATADNAGQFDRRTDVGGRRGLVTQLSNVSEVTGQQEYVALTTTYLRNGNMLYMIGVAPRDEAGTYDRAFQRVRDSIALQDR